MLYRPFIGVRFRIIMMLLSKNINQALKLIDYLEKHYLRVVQLLYIEKMYILILSGQYILVNEEKLNYLYGNKIYIKNSLFLLLFYKNKFFKVIHQQQQ
ncbi:hypothetical protein pb186bvf_016610 [Paramecium bursaria]